MLPNGEAYGNYSCSYHHRDVLYLLRVKTATLTTRKTWTSHNKHRHILQPAHRLHGSRHASIQTHTCAQTQRGRLMKAKAQGLSSDLKVSCMKPSWNWHSSRRRYITDYINCLFLGYQDIRGQPFCAESELPSCLALAILAHWISVSVPCCLNCLSWLSVPWRRR